MVSSETIAEGAGVQHKNVLELIDTNRADFEEFGDLAFETRDRAGVPGPRLRIALLKEQQATLLMTYQRNSERVRAFKNLGLFEVIERTVQGADGTPTVKVTGKGQQYFIDRYAPKNALDLGAVA